MIWIPKEEQKALEKWGEKLQEIQMQILWGIYTPPEPKEDHHVKYAWVEIDGKREMIGVDNKTLKGYQMITNPEGGPQIWKMPLEELQYDKFIRWCTTFDL